MRISENNRGGSKDQKEHMRPSENQGFTKLYI
jgi:hypothetical protein